MTVPDHPRIISEMISRGGKSNPQKVGVIYIYIICYIFLLKKGPDGLRSNEGNDLVELLLVRGHRI